jgi:hypothetical protein
MSIDFAPELMPRPLEQHPQMLDQDFADAALTLKGIRSLLSLDTPPPDRGCYADTVEEVRSIRAKIAEVNPGSVPSRVGALAVDVSPGQYPLFAYRGLD